MMPDSQDERAGMGAVDDEPSELVGVPGFASGGRVERTGIALVHQGEYIVPAPGSEAVIVSDGERAGYVANYYFPIEVEFVGQLDEHQLKQVASYIFAEIHSELDSRGPN